MEFTAYYSYYGRPLFIERRTDGTLMGYRLVPGTGEFERTHDRVVDDVQLAGDDAQVLRLDRDTFIEDTERTRSESVHGTGPIFEICAIVDEIRRTAIWEKRQPTRDESRMIRTLYRQTFSWWEECEVARQHHTDLSRTVHP
ncbi:hypothetical protein [Nocardia sp. NPDC004123]